MAHYAWLDINNIVINVTVGVDETELINGLDTETFYTQATGYNIKRTSFNNNIRFNYAGIGYTYDVVRDAFIAPEPDNAIGFDEETCRWLVPQIEP